MNRTQLIADIARRSDTSQETVDRILGCFEDVVLDRVRSGEQVALPGFFTVDVTERAARTGRNPRDGSTIDIPAARVPRVKVGARLKRAAKDD